VLCRYLAVRAGNVWFLERRMGYRSLVGGFVCVWTRQADAIVAVVRDFEEFSDNNSYFFTFTFLSCKNLV
jgi:hypothetical protein